MARMYGGASQYLKKIEKIDSIAAIAYLVILAFICYAVFVKNFRYLFSLGGLIGIAISFGPFAWFAYYRYRKHIIEHGKFYRGRKGEGAVWYKLIKLSNEYSVFQDVKTGDAMGNIDFVIVGPGGVYALEVKSHSGKIDFDGEKLTNNGRPFEKDFLKQARTGAFQINDFLKTKIGIDIFVKPVLVFSGHASMRFGLKSIGGVYVIGKSFLEEFFKKEPIIDFPKSKIEEALKEII